MLILIKFKVIFCVELFYWNFKFVYFFKSKKYAFTVFAVKFHHLGLFTEAIKRIHLAVAIQPKIR